MIKVTSRRTRV